MSAMAHREDSNNSNASADALEATATEEKLASNSMDSCYSWVITFAFMINSFIVDGIANSFGLVLPDLCKHFNASKSSVSLIGSLLIGVYLLVGPIAAPLVTKFGCRPVCIAGSIVAALGFAISSFSTNLVMLTLSYGVMGGFGYGLVYLPSMVCINFYFVKYRALAMGLAVCGSGIGTIVMGPVTTILLQSLEWQNTFLVFGAISLIAGVTGALMRPNNSKEMPIENYQLTTKRRNNSEANLPTSQARQPFFTSAPNRIDFNVSSMPSIWSSNAAGLNSVPSETSSGSSRCSPRQILKRCSLMIDTSILKNPGFIAICIGNFLCMLAFYAPLFFVPDYSLEIGVTDSQAKYLNAAFGIANTVVRILVGLLVSHPRVSALLVNNLSMALSCLLSFTLLLCNSFASVITVFILFGVALGPIIALTSEVLFPIVGEAKMINAIGFLFVARGLSVCVGAPLTGSLYNEHTRYMLPFIVGGVLFGVSCVAFCIPFLPALRRRQAQADIEITPVAS